MITESEFLGSGTERMKTIWLDKAVGAWVLLAGAAFIVPFVWPDGADWTELGLVARYVYLVVVTAGVVGLALRALRMVRR